MIAETVRKALTLFLSKEKGELLFWQTELLKYQKWFKGELPSLYKTPSPREEQQVQAPNLKDASILTWHKLHQEVKYLADLDLDPTAFQGMKVLDVGSGPIPSATCFRACELYCLEPLLPKYLEAGYPLHYYQNVHFVHAAAEEMPIESHFFDAVISVNALDHVNNIQKTAEEMGRVLRAGGLFRVHVHYHPPTPSEPVEFNDQVFQKLFSWCAGLKKVKTTSSSHSTNLPAGQSFVLWSNF